MTVHDNNKAFANTELIKFPLYLWYYMYYLVYLRLELALIFLMFKYHIHNTGHLDKLIQITV